MTRYEVPALRKALLTLAETFARKPPTEGVVADVWFAHLQAYPLTDLLDVLHDWPRDHDSYPTVAQVRKVVMERRARWAQVADDRKVAAEPIAEGPNRRAFRVMWSETGGQVPALRAWCERAAADAQGPLEQREFARAVLERMAPPLSPVEAARRAAVAQRMAGAGAIQVAIAHDADAEREARAEREAIMAEGEQCAS